MRAGPTCKGSAMRPLLTLSLSSYYFIVILLFTSIRSSERLMLKMILKVHKFRPDPLSMRTLLIQVLWMVTWICRGLLWWGSRHWKYLSVNTRCCWAGKFLIMSWNWDALIFSRTRDLVRAFSRTSLWIGDICRSSRMDICTWVFFN